MMRLSHSIPESLPALTWGTCITATVQTTILEPSDAVFLNLLAQKIDPTFVKQHAAEFLSCRLLHDGSLENQVALFAAAEPECSSDISALRKYIGLYRGAATAIYERLYLGEIQGCSLAGFRVFEAQHRQESSVDSHGSSARGAAIWSWMRAFRWRSARVLGISGTP